MGLALAALLAPFAAHLYVRWSSQEHRAPARGANLVLNSGFEDTDGAAGAAYWFAQGDGSVERDPEVCRAGRFSLRLSSGSDGEGAAAGTPLALAPLSETVHIEGYAKARSLRGRAFIRLTFFAADGSGPVSEPQTSSLTGTSDWKLLRTSARVPASAGSAVLQVVVEGRGTVWFDNVRALAADAWDPGAPHSPARPGPLRNGSFEELTEAGLPRHWLLGERAAVDASVSRSGVCSLRVEPGATEEMAALARQDYAPPASPGSRTAAQVHVSSRQRAGAALSIACLDSKGRLIAEHIDSGTAEGGGWSRLFVDFTVPPGCAVLRMTLSAGGGECWFDDAAAR